MMTDLSEAIVQTSQEVSGLLQQLTQDMQEVSARIQQADALVTKGRDRLLNNFKTISGSVQDLGQTFEEQAQAINDCADQIDAQAQDWSAQIESMSLEFQTTLDGANQLLTEYDELVANCAITAQDWLQDHFTIRLEDSHTALKEIDDDLQTGFDTFASALEGFAENMQERQTAWEQVIDKHLNELGQVAQEAAQTVNDKWVAFLDHQAQEFAGEIERTVTGPLTDSAQNMMETARNALGIQIKGLISELSQRIKDILRQISDEVTHSTSSSSETREMLKPIFDELQEVTDLLKEVMEAVQQVAELVGIRV